MYVYATEQCLLCFPSKRQLGRDHIDPGIIVVRIASCVSSAGMRRRIFIQLTVAAPKKTLSVRREKKETRDFVENDREKNVKENVARTQLR